MKTKTAKHTAGPWTTDYRSHCYGVYGADGDAVCYVSEDTTAACWLRAMAMRRALALSSYSPPALLDSLTDLLKALDDKRPSKASADKVYAAMVRAKKVAEQAEGSDQ